MRWQRGTSLAVAILVLTVGIKALALSGGKVINTMEEPLSEIADELTERGFSAELDMNAQMVRAQMGECLLKARYYNPRGAEYDFMVADAEQFGSGRVAYRSQWIEGRPSLFTLVEYLVQREFSRMRVVYGRPAMIFVASSTACPPLDPEIFDHKVRQLTGPQQAA